MYLCIMTNEAKKITTLADVAEIRPGYPFRGRIDDDPNGFVRAIQMKDVDRGGLINWGGAVRTELLGKRKPDWLGYDDILFVTRGSRNYAVWVGEVPVKAVASPHFFLLRVQSNFVLPQFLAWQINQAPARRYLEACAVGSVQLSIRRTSLERLPVTIPEMTIQRTVVKAVDCVNQQIAIYNKSITNCEQQIKAVAETVLAANRRKI